MIQFFSAYAYPLTTESFQRLLSQVISSAKSSNPVVRANSVKLFKALIRLSDPSDPDNLARIAVPELISLPKSGKSAGPDHRIALYSMLGFLQPAKEVSSGLVQAAAVLVPKEPNEGAVGVLVDTLPRHITFLLLQGSLSSDSIQFIAKEMTNAKPAVRKPFIGLAGAVFTDGRLGEQKDILETENGKAFAKALLPSFEASLKAVASNPLNSPGGPLEGYVAVAVLLGSLAPSKQFGGCHLCLRPASLQFVDGTLTSRRHYKSECRYQCHRQQRGQAIVLALGESVSKDYGRTRGEVAAQGMRCSPEVLCS